MAVFPESLKKKGGVLAQIFPATDLASFNQIFPATDLASFRNHFETVSWAGGQHFTFTAHGSVVWLHWQPVFLQVFVQRLFQLVPKMPTVLSSL